MNYEKFSKKELGESIDILHSSIFCKTEKDFITLMEKAKGLIGGEYSISGLGIYDEKGLIDSKTIVNSSYPEEWLTVYQEKKLYFIDPIVIQQYSSSGTQLWTDTYKNYKSKNISKFIYNASAYGIKYGITSGIKSSHNKIGSIITFSNSNNYFGEHQKELMDVIVPSLHQALVRIYKILKSDNIPPITSREAEILRWAKEGKTNWEISMILNISERTVKFHLKNIMEKLNAVNKTHAMAIMMEHEHKKDEALVY